jgi:hypothetical protein
MLLAYRMAALGVVFTHSEYQLGGCSGRDISVGEFATKDMRQYCLGQEVFFSGADPAGVIRRGALQRE